MSPDFKSVFATSSEIDSSHDYMLCVWSGVTPSVADMADAIQKHEGWYEGSRSYRNNNPGNLRVSPYQSGHDGGFAIFDSYEMGRYALERQIIIAIENESSVYHNEMTLLDFFSKYAPSYDSNNPHSYAEYVANHLGVETSFTLAELSTSNLP